MRSYRSYTVLPKLPETLQAVRDLAFNLWWAFTPSARELLRRVDRDLWEQTHNNPVAMLGLVSQERWQRLAEDESFLQHLKRVQEELQAYLSAETWFSRAHPEVRDQTIAYFSFEYGISECLPLYAGGLGVLAGDHLKSASDMGVPICGVGLLYQVGYFHQYLNPDGWQQEEYVENDFHSMPVEPVRDAEGRQVRIKVPSHEGEITALLWRANVGRVPLYLLDTNTPENRPADREITYQLYGGGVETRIRQELLLGLGGLQALDVLGIKPAVYHLNEGHAAFLALERVRRAMEQDNLSFAEAFEATRVSNVFTTHTPVAAGHDRFHRTLIEKYLKHYYPRLGLTLDELMNLGAPSYCGPTDEFWMTALALRFSAWRNGVSRLHGEVTRKAWAALWPGVPHEEVPIGAITNGVHVGSFISDDMAVLFDRYLGEDWRIEPGEPAVWQRVADIPASELWRAHERRRERLVAVARRRLVQQLEQRGASQQELEVAREALHPEVLTIGFARRFVSYKRADLILRNPERLKKLLTDRDRPIQIVFAGKAHPEEVAGKELIRQVVHFTRDPEVRQRVVFLENYDLHLARYIVQGVDVWLNNPRRPLEASGTSGMKVTANGGLNCSILDGWWAEGYSPETGWAIGHGEEYADPEQQDQVESEALYTLLEQEIIPLFYDRGADGIPHGWVAKMKSAMQAICPYFNSNRMVREYLEQFYLPAMRHSARLAENGYQRARQLAAWRTRLSESWCDVRFINITDNVGDVATFDDRITVRAEVALGRLQPSDVSVQLQYGPVDAAGEIRSPQVLPMQHVGETGTGIYLFEGTIVCNGTGQWGYNLRVIPAHEDLISPFDIGVVMWAECPIP